MQVMLVSEEEKSVSLLFAALWDVVFTCTVVMHLTHRHERQLADVTSDAFAHASVRHCSHHYDGNELTYLLRNRPRRNRITATH